MSASDGYVTTTSKIVDHGPDSDRWNLVIVGDGYTEAELPTYHSDVQNFLTTLRSTPPFDEMFCGINVYRIDVVSDESGADIPSCAPEGPITRDTYFDATFCTNFAGSPLERLLTVNDTLVFDTVNPRVPARDQILCIINSSKYGGAGGAIATCSTDSAAAQIAIHEIGHSAFGLADEYGGDGSATPAGEPSQPNVTRDTNLATNKWNSFITPGTPMPSGCDGSCTSSTCVPPATAPPAGTVGTYEGGIYSDCDVYRPLPDCMMRNLGVPFCPVCADVIRQTLQPFQPAETISLITPSISFANVPAGMGGIGITTHRAIVWEVVTCRELTFEITDGPTGGFGTPEGTSVTVTADPIGPVGHARIWISYTSTSPGDNAMGNITVECVETGESWLITIMANTIARPKSAVSLVLDRSGSMDDDAGDATTKVQKLREAADVFISVMAQGDGIGLVTFNQTASRLMEITDAGAAPGGAGRTTAINHINSNALQPGGSTSIGDGVVNGKNMLDDAQASASPPYDVLAQVILTDGMWNQPPSLADVSGSISANTFAVGLGLPSNISVPALTTLCQGHNGYLLVTGMLTTDQSLRLSKYFLQILAGITNAEVASDPGGVLTYGAEHRIPYYITEADFGMDLVVLSRGARYIEFTLESPDGTRFDPSSGGSGANMRYVVSNNVAYYRCALPALPANSDGSHAGKWHAILKLGKRRGQDDVPTHVPSSPNYEKVSLPYEFVAHTYSALTFGTTLDQNSFEPGASVQLNATLLEYDAPFLGSASVWVEVKRPDGGVTNVSLQLSESGRYEDQYQLNANGLYIFRIRAKGQTRYGRPFEREKTLTAVAVPGGNKWTPDIPEGSDLCKLISCLSQKGMFTDEFFERMKKYGVNMQALLKCLGSKCRDTRTRQEGSRKGNNPLKALPDTWQTDLDIDDLAKIIAEQLKKGF